MSRPTYLYKEIVRIGRNGTEEEAQDELHNATRERQEWKKPLGKVGKWPWARYRSVFGHDGFIVEIYTLYTPLRIVISKVERISRGVLTYKYISIVRFDNGRVFPEKNWRIVVSIGLRERMRRIGKVSNHA